MKFFRLFFAAGFALISLACARITDLPKAVWGSSTRALEEARAEGLKKTFRCTVDECLNEVVKIAQTPRVIQPQTDPDTLVATPAPETKTPPAKIEDKKAEEPAEEKVSTAQTLDLFIVDRARNRIVVMGVPGSVDTTEVGIFFTPLDNGARVDISSLSSNAKRTVAETIFPVLTTLFGEVK